MGTIPRHDSGMPLMKDFMKDLRSKQGLDIRKKNLLFERFIGEIKKKELVEKKTKRKASVYLLMKERAKQNAKLIRL